MTNNTPDIQSFLDDMAPTLHAVDKVLSEWDGIGCYQIPIFLMKLKSEMNWDDKKMRARDPLVREYLRDHSKYAVVKGAGGGIVLRAKLQEKQAAKLAKVQAKVDVLNTIDTLLAQKLAATQKANDNDNIVVVGDDDTTTILSDTE